MNYFNSIRDLIGTLKRGDELISEMFNQRNSIYLYEYALKLFDYNEDIINLLLDKKIIARNGTYLELEEQFLDFFEKILEVNEEINTSYINENIQQVKENIEYYLQSNTEKDYFKYLKNIKSILQRIGKSTVRNIADLSRNIDNTFKAEANYKIKLAKLENHKQKLESIQDLIKQAERLLNEDELTFFKVATDEKLKEIRYQLILDLTESRHYLIEIRKQIIEYINQVKYKSKFIEKLRQLKYLRNQFEIKHKTNIYDVLSNNNALVFEPKQSYRLKLSIENLQQDASYALIKKIRNNYNSIISPIKYLAENLTEQEIKLDIEQEISIDLYKVRNDFKLTGKDLFQFIMDYQFIREVSFGERVTFYCQIISLFESELELYDKFVKQGNIEYAIVYPRI